MSNKKLKKGEQPLGRMRIENGSQICVLAGPRSWTIENWIIDVREQLPEGTDVDWCFQGGRAFVVGSGDIDAVTKAITNAKDALNKEYHDEQDSPGEKYDVQWLGV